MGIRAQVETDVFENGVDEMIVSSTESVVGVVGSMHSAWDRCRTMLGIQDCHIDSESNRVIREVMETTRIGVNENTVRAANSVEKLVRIIAVNGDNSNTDWIGRSGGLKIYNSATRKKQKSDLQRNRNSRCRIGGREEIAIELSESTRRCWWIMNNMRDG